jgi:hypothetical protein
MGLSFLILFSLLALIKTKSAKVALNVPLAIILLMVPWSLGFMKEVFSPSNKNPSLPKDIQINNKEQGRGMDKGGRAR